MNPRYLTAINSVQESVITPEPRASKARLRQLKDKLPCDKDSALNLGDCPTP